VFEDVAHRVFEGMPLEEDTQPLAEQVMFGVTVSGGPAYVLFNEMSPKEMATAHLYQADFMPPMMSDGMPPKVLAEISG
jgi:hypothetical protein